MLIIIIVDHIIRWQPCVPERQAGHEGAARTPRHARAGQPTQPTITAIQEEKTRKFLAAETMRSKPVFLLLTETGAKQKIGSSAQRAPGRPARPAPSALRDVP